jgi:hypothetical protein
LRSLSTPWRRPEDPTVFHAADATIAVTSARRSRDGESRR